MKRFLLIFAAAALGCTQAAQLPSYAVTYDADSSEEDYHVLLPNVGGTKVKGELYLPGVGIVQQPVIQAVKVNVPSSAYYKYTNAYWQQLWQMLGVNGGIPIGVPAGGPLAAPVGGALGGPFGGPIGGALGGPFGGPFGGPIGGALGGPFGGPFGGPAGGLVAIPVSFPFRVPVGASRVPLPTPKTAAQERNEQGVDVEGSVTQAQLEQGQNSAYETNAQQVQQTKQEKGPLRALGSVPQQAVPSVVNLIVRSRRHLQEKASTTNKPSTIPSAISSTTTVPHVNPSVREKVTASKLAGQVAENVTPSTHTNLMPVKNNKVQAAAAFNLEAQQHKLTMPQTPVPPLPPLELDMRSGRYSEKRLTDSRATLALGNVKRNSSSINSSAAHPSAASAESAKATTTKAPNNKCDIGCNKFHLDPVCAFNGQCYHEFPNRCVLDTFVCKHPELGFKATKQPEQCLSGWVKRCRDDELSQKVFNLYL